VRKAQIFISVELTRRSEHCQMVLYFVQLNRRFALKPWRWAICAAETPGRLASATTRFLNETLYQRRCVLDLVVERILLPIPNCFGKRRRSDARQQPTRLLCLCEPQFTRF
jgi:hypothetical protein